MASERIKKIEITDFGGIDRTASSNDTPIQKARISRDGRRLPTGRFVRREEYDQLYDYRQQQFEHTTDDDASPSAREVRGDGVGAGAAGDAEPTQEIPDTHEVYRSHGRKMVCLGKNGTTEYTFTGYVEIRPSRNTHTLFLERGSRAAGALDVTWTVNGANCRKTIFETPAHAGYVDDWIEFSMVMNATKDAISMIVTVHETDGVASTVVYHYTLTTLYAATVAGITATQTGTIESSTDITRDVDIEISAAGDTLYAIWGRTVAGDDVIRASAYVAGAWNAATQFTVAGFDLFGISIVRAPGTTTLYVNYSTDNVTRRIQYVSSTDALATFSAATQVTSSLQLGGTAFYHRGVFAIDNDGTLHWVWLHTAGGLAHYYSGGTEVIMTDPVETTIANEDTTGWDFVVKDGCVSIFYIDAGTPLNTYKAVRVVTTGDVEAGVYNIVDYTETVRHDLVEVRATGIDARYFGTYRKYEQNSNLRLSWVSCATVTTTTNIRFLHSDKGLYEIDDTHSATNGSYVTTAQVQIEAANESLIQNTSETGQQILIIQCSDNRLYKRVSYQWMLLEGQRTVTNAGWNWVTVYDDHARFLRHTGTLRILAGDGATNQNAWYGYVDRYFFNNTTADRYADHVSALARPAPPGTGVLQAFTAIFSVANPDADGDSRWSGFVEANGDTKIYSKYVFYDDGNPAPYSEFFGAISLEYDGVTESELRVQTADGNITLGRIPRGDEALLMAWAYFDLQLFSWNSTNAARISHRVTAVNLYLGEMQIAEDTKETVKYYKVKRVQVSAIQPTGENAFADVNYLGTGTWAVTAATGEANPTDNELGYVDYSMWQVALAPGGSAEDNAGTAMVRYRSTGSGTELYTKFTTVPEGYHYGIVLGDEIWAAGIRMAGVTMKNRLMRTARKIGNQVTPDRLTDDVRTIRDFPYDVLELSQIDDTNLVVLGRSGVEIFDVSGGVLNKRNDITDIGTDATDSVWYLKEGGAGKTVKGVIFKDAVGHIRLFDGYGSTIISDPIRDDYDGTNQGVLSLDMTGLITVYIPLYRCLFIIYGTQMFVLDFASGMDWQDWRFLNSIEAVCVGVDGEMLWTDRYRMFVWPQAGTVDSPDPQWRGADLDAPADMRIIPKNVWMDYICAGTTTLIPRVYKDRGSATAATSTLAASATQTRGRSGYLRSDSAARREIALGFGVTTAANLTALEVDKMVQELLIVPRRP